MTPHTQQLIVHIDAILPQTQCTQCGYSGCQPYAEAIASGKADINQCPPGGETGIQALAKLLQLPYKPLNPAHGAYKPKALAFIDEASCIGCTLCIQACPVDAIVGASKQMHTVIARECTGCELCLPPCPVDCISMQTANIQSAEEKLEAANLARQRYNSRLQRLKRDKLKREQLHAERAKNKPGVPNKQDVIAAAIARAKAQMLVK